MLDLERLGASCEGDWNGAGEGGRNSVGGGVRYENRASVVRGGVGGGGRYENGAYAVRNVVGEGGRYENGASAVRNGVGGGGCTKGASDCCAAWLAFTLHKYGNFSIWHRDADIWMLDLERLGASCEGGRDGVGGGGCTKGSSDCCAAWPATALNSDETESYHCWSSNGRWLVFSSRRDDGLFTRPYIAYIDRNGLALMGYKETFWYYMLLTKV